MKKAIVGILGIVVVVIVCVLSVGYYRFNFTNGGDIIPAINAPDAKNMSYSIDGVLYTLKEGVSTVGSSSTVILRMFGEPTYGDLNNDGAQDAAITLVYTPGGSGTFYYAVLALSNNKEYRSTNALLLGDRIAPQSVSITDSRAVYSFAERKADEPMSAQPSIGKSVTVYIDPTTGDIGELVQNFEGEADPDRVSLGMKKWEWITTETNDGTVAKPKIANKFTLSFGADGRVSIGTDCNSMSATYTIKDKSLIFGPIMSTKMYCEGSQEGIFARNLENIASYFFTSKGELILEIKFDSGTMTFR